jgi:hypothetical protein
MAGDAVASDMVAICPELKSSVNEFEHPDEPADQWE